MIRSAWRFPALLLAAIGAAFAQDAAIDVQRKHHHY